jgi:glycerophosphoryl diester phosphodiesterase
MSPSKLPFLYTSNGDEFVVIAHRGASAYAPENTHSAFKLAIEMQAEMIELDLLLSKDGGASCYS